MPVIVFKKNLLLPVGEVSFWSISVGEGFPQRHQGDQTQHRSSNMVMYVISGTPRRDLDDRNALFVVEEDGSFIRQDLLPCTVITG